ncbi:pre-mRNA-splicing factor SYF2-like [Cynocephalus volans]|uniref:pre-mRNA-splicing factor SYF2-like n=1 Tax=Cynocephalus volans TaxID=110931 RepID=UPI002FC6FADE
MHIPGAAPEVGKGEDYEDEVTRDQCRRCRELGKEKEKETQSGIFSYAAAQLHQYHQLTKQIKPDIENGEVYSASMEHMCLPQKKLIEWL